MKTIRIIKFLGNGRVRSILIPAEDREGNLTVTVGQLRDAIHLLEDDADLLEIEPL